VDDHAVHRFAEPVVLFQEIQIMSRHVDRDGRRHCEQVLLDLDGLRELQLKRRGCADRIPSQGTQAANDPRLDLLRELPGSAAALLVLVPPSAPSLREFVEHAGHQFRRGRFPLEIAYATRNRIPGLFENRSPSDDLSLVAEIQTQWVDLFCDQRHGLT